MLPALQNQFINQFLRHVLDGNSGSNWLTAILVPLLGAQIDWVKAYRGLQFENSDDVTEAAKVAGIVVLAVWGVFIGRQKPAH